MTAEIGILILTLGLADTNAYIVGDTATKRAILIDPVDEAPLLLKTATEAGYTIGLIIATHAHFDHVLASRELKELTGAPFVIHAEAVPMLEMLPAQGMRFTGRPFPAAAEPDVLLDASSAGVVLDGIRLKPLYTPGHAPGHLSFYMADHSLVFSGDALFAGSIGRTDLPGGSLDVLLNSIRTQLLTLDDEVQVLPGHGGPTTIGEERRTNPFLQW